MGKGRSPSFVKAPRRPCSRDERDADERRRRTTAMSTMSRYARTPDASEWRMPQTFDTTFRWEYEDGRDKLLGLYEKGKRLQWNAATRIDWSQDLDPENPAGLPDEVIPIFGSEPWNRLTDGERRKLRHHFQAW